MKNNSKAYFLIIAAVIIWSLSGLLVKAINVLAKTEEEKDFLTNTMVPTMLVGGFTTVTLGSVVFAGILTNFL